MTNDALFWAGASAVATMLVMVTTVELIIAFRQWLAAWRRWRRG